MKKALIGLLAAGTLVGCGGNTYTITGKPVSYTHLTLPTIA